MDMDYADCLVEVNQMVQKILILVVFNSINREKQFFFLICKENLGPEYIPSLWKMAVRCTEGQRVCLTLGSDVVFLLKAVGSNNSHNGVYISLCTFYVCLFMKA